MPKSIVKKSYPIITAVFNLRSAEQDVLTLIFKELKSKNYNIDHHNFNENEVQTEFTFSNSQLCEQLKVSKDSLYKTMKKTLDSIMSKKALIHNDKTKKIDGYSLIARAKFENGELFLRVDEDTARLMLDYSKGFAQIDFDLSISLNGEYEKRILDLISLDKKIDRQYSIVNLCHMFSVNLSDYKSFEYFRRTVLEKPIQRLIAASNGMWTAKEGFPKGYVISKTGRSYKDSDKITFKLQYNAPEEEAKAVSTVATEEEMLTPEIVYKTLVEIGGVGQLVAEDAGLDIDSLKNFMDCINSDSRYGSMAGNAWMIISNTEARNCNTKNLKSN